MPAKPDEGRCVTVLSPPHERRRREFDRWVRNVRNPANANREGRRRVECDGAEAEYDVAPLLDGRWAVRMSFGYDCGNCHGRAIPWTDYAMRQACVESFLHAARGHFAQELHPADSCVSQAQQRARLRMLQLLSDGLFGFMEPDPECEPTETPLSPGGDT